MKLGLALLVGSLWFPPSEPGDAHDNEWTVRSWALGGGAEAREQLDVALASSDWRERARGLAALARRVEALTPEQVAACLACLEFEHPSVKAAALDALAKAGVELDLSAAPLDSLATAKLPEVRAALARLLGRCGAGSAQLAELAVDSDPRVREDARHALFGQLGDERAEQLLAQLFDTGSLHELVAALEGARRLCITRAGEQPALAVEAELAPGPRALLAAARLARGSGTSDELDALLSGWFSVELDPYEAWLLVTETASVLDAAGAEQLVELWLAVDRDHTERWPRALEACRALGAEADEQRDALLRTATDALGARRVVRLASTGTVTPDGRCRLLEFAATRLTRWEREVAHRFLDADEPEVRDACLLALGQATVAGDPVAAALLAEVLESGSLRERELCFQWLCNAPVTEPWLEPLFRAWSEFDAESQLVLLRELTRKTAPTPFRASLIELGEAGGSRRDAVLDLLGLFHGDEALAARLAEWTRSELSRALEGELGGPSTAERRAAGALRALDSITDEVQSEPLLALALELLQRTARASEHISETAVEVLGRDPERLADLSALLEPPTRERTRARLAIALAPTGDERAFELLCELLPGLPWELAFRAIRALGQLGHERARSALVAFALNASLSPELRRAAALQLDRTEASAEERELLRRIAQEGLDVQTMAAALRALGHQGAPGRAALLELYELFEGGGESRLAQLRGDYRELARSELLMGLAETGDFPDELLGEVLARPLDAAGEWLDTRLRGEESAKIDFVWREELELFGVLGRAGRARAVLTAAGEWWRMDGRLLVLLGELAERFESPPADGERENAELAAELLRAGLVALQGEASSTDAYALRARLALLRLALGSCDWTAAARHAERLVAEWREDRIPERTWRGTLGSRDVGEQRDPPARLAALRFQAEARVALEAGERERARQLADRAHELVGFSAIALWMQTALEARLTQGDSQQGD